MMDTVSAISSEDTMVFNEWKKNAICYQDCFSRLLEDRIWDEFKSEEKHLMYSKLAPALFERPLADDTDLGYSKNQKDLVVNIINTMVRYSVYKDKIHMAIIFVCIYDNQRISTAPVIRVRTTESTEETEIPNNAFIDHVGRFYKNWKTFLTTNQWYRSWLCVPNNGYYSSERDYRFVNQKNRGSLLMKLDCISAKTNIVSTTTMITGAVVSFFPPLSGAGVALMATSMGIGAPGMVFGIFRSAKSLMDRKQHLQSISLKNNEARQSWLLLSGCVLALGTFGCSKFIAAWASAGRAIPGTTKLLFSSLQISSIGISGGGLFNSLYKLKNEKRKLSSLEILHVTTSILLFTHSLLSVKTMNTIINGEENNTILSELKNEQLKLNCILNNDVNSVIKHKQEFIRNLKKINNISSLFSKFKETASNQMKALSSELLKFCSLTEPIKAEIKSLLGKLTKQQITEIQFMNEVPKKVQDFAKVNKKTNKAKSEEFDSILKTLKIGDEGIDKLISIERAIFNKIIKAFYEELRPVWKVLKNFKFETSFQFYQCVTKFVDYIQNELLQRRIEDPSPSRSTGVCVTQHYKLEVEKEISEQVNSETRLENELKELYESCQKDSFEIEGFIPELNILSFELCYSIVDELAGSEITIKQWLQKDFSLECMFETKYNIVENISFINIDDSLVLVVYDAKEQYRLYIV